MSKTPSPAVRAVGIAIGISVLLGALVSWFAWPAKELEPRDLPVVVAGPAPATAAISQQLASALPGAFEVTTAADAAAADQALREREAYAAFVVGADGVSLHTASGASPIVATLLSQAAQQLGGGRPVAVVDVVPGAPDDPRGAGFATGYLPLVLASMIGGILLAIALSGWRERLAGLAALAVMGGLVGAGVLHGLEILTGSYLGRGWRDRAARLGGERYRHRPGVGARRPGHRPWRAARLPLREPDLGRGGRAGTVTAAMGNDRPAAAARRWGDPAAFRGVLQRRRFSRTNVDTRGLGRAGSHPGGDRPYSDQQAGQRGPSRGCAAGVARDVITVRRQSSRSRRSWREAGQIGAIIACGT